jgi:hypothetical protein
MTAVPVYVARRRFGPEAGERWTRYVAWSRLSQLRELVSLDAMLCPAVPEELAPQDWEHNVHADYQTNHFRSFEYLRRRVAGVPGHNLLAILREPTAGDLRQVALPGFTFAGFDLLDVHGDVSALTNCGGFDDIFAPEELNPLGLLSERGRPGAVRRGLRAAYPEEHHAVCDVWALWRWTGADREATAGSPS